MALGAFLSHRGVTTPLGVFGVTWIANCAGAIGVYLVTYRYGPAFTAGRIGRRLITPGRCGGDRTRVCPIRHRRHLLHPFPARRPRRRARVRGTREAPSLKGIIPICLASGLWYATITFLAARLGAEWDTVTRWISNINRSLGLLALGLVVGIVVIIYRRRHERRRKAGVKLRLALEQEAAHPHAERDPALRNAAALVLELALADEELGEEEQQLVEAHLIERWDLERPSGASPTELADQADQLTGDFSIEDRVELLHRMWRAATARRPSRRAIEQRTAGAGGRAARDRSRTTMPQRVARESWSGLRQRSDGRTRRCPRRPRLPDR